MSDWVEESHESQMKAIRGEAPRMKFIDMSGKGGHTKYTKETVEALVRYPNSIEGLSVSCAELGDDVGVRIAEVLRTSTTIKTLSLNHNNFTEITFKAIAEALRTNRSLWYLNLHNNPATYNDDVLAVFRESLKANPNRPKDSHWFLYTGVDRVWDWYKYLAFGTTVY